MVCEIIEALEQLKFKLSFNVTHWVEEMNSKVLLRSIEGILFQNSDINV